MTRNSSWGDTSRKAPKTKNKIIPIHSCEKTLFRFIPKKTPETEKTPVLKKNAPHRYIFDMFILLEITRTREGIAAATTSSIFEQLVSFRSYKERRTQSVTELMAQSFVIAFSSSDAELMVIPLMNTSQNSILINPFSFHPSLHEQQLQDHS